MSDDAAAASGGPVQPARRRRTAWQAGRRRRRSVDEVVKLLDKTQGVSRPLRKSLDQVRADLHAFRGRTLGEGLGGIAGGPHGDK